MILCNKIMMNGFSFNFALAVICVIFLKNIPKTESTIRCYKCSATLPQYYTNETVRLCKDFDYSAKFIVECPYSTFCTKRFFTAKIPTVINGTDRDCASQKHVIQKYKNGSWHPQVQMEEPYTNGCHKVNDKGARTTYIENCYCNTDLCNSGRTLVHNGMTGMLMAVIAFLIL